MKTTNESTTAFLDGIRELSRGDERGALAAFERALAGRTDRILGRLCSARLLLLQRRFDEARVMLEWLVSEAPGRSEPWYLLGCALRGEYDTVEAARCFRAALVRDPSDARAAAALAEIVDADEP